MLTPTATPTGSVAPLVEILRRLEQTHGPPCADWSDELFELALDVRVHELEFETRLLMVSARACELGFLADGGEFGFAARLASPAAHAVDARDFDAAQLADLALLADSGAPPGFTARAMDLRWSVLADSGAGASAVAAYTRLALDCARSTPVRRMRAADAIARAAQIAVVLGSGSEVSEILSDAVAELLELARADGDAVLLQRCLQIHERFGLGDPEVLATLAIEGAEREVAVQRDHRACELYRIAERFLRRSTRPAEAGVLAVVRSSVLAHAARRRQTHGEPAWICASFLRLALEELDHAPDAKEFSAGLQHEIDQLSACTSPGAGAADTSSYIARAMHACASRLDRIAPCERVSSAGALAAEPHPERSAPSIDFERLWTAGPLSPRAASRAVPAAARDAWVAPARVFASSVFEVARRALAAEPAATREGLARLLDGNALVPRECAGAFERGLLACIEGDGVLGLSLLVPQLAGALEREGVAGALSPGLRAAAETLLAGDGAWALRDKLARGTLAPREYSQETANLVLWLALRVLRRYARTMHHRSTEPASNRKLLAARDRNA